MCLGNCGILEYDRYGDGDVAVPYASVVTRDEEEVRVPEQVTGRKNGRRCITLDTFGKCFVSLVRIYPFPR